MKKWILFFLSLGVVLSSCKKNEDDGSSGMDEEMAIRYFEYKLDGTEIRRDSIFNDTLYIMEASSIIIRFEEAGKDEKLIFAINPFDGENEYPDIYIQHDDAFGFCADTSGGYINVLNIDLEQNYIEGTFSGLCNRPGGKEVTDGAFLIDYFE